MAAMGSHSKPDETGPEIPLPENNQALDKALNEQKEFDRKLRHRLQEQKRQVIESSLVGTSLDGLARVRVSQEKAGTKHDVIRSREAQELRRVNSEAVSLV